MARTRWGVRGTGFVVATALVVAVSADAFARGGSLARSAGGAPLSEAFVLPSSVVKEPKLDSQLAQVASVAAARGVAAARAAAEARSLDVGRAGAEVVVEAMPGASASARAAVELLGGTVERVRGNLLEAAVPITKLRGLASDPAVRFLAPPAAAEPLAVNGEAPTASNAAASHAAGITGSGVKVAVIDLGFAGYSSRQSSGDLPGSLTTVDYCSTTLGAPESHGTAVAEIVHEMAPGASLYVICVDSQVDLVAAKDYAVAQGVSIVVHSVGWFNTSRGDGSGGAGTPDATVAAARSSGILWVNAAGNQARDHWSGTFTDANANGLHDFAAGDEGNTLTIAAGESFCGWLKWDSWPTTSQDFDLYLARSSDGTIFARSDNVQSGSQRPTEAI